MNRQTIVSVTLFCVGIAVALAWRFAISPQPQQGTVSTAPARMTRTRAVAPERLLGRQTVQNGLVRREVLLMGSSFTFVVDAPPDEAARAIDAAVTRLRELERQISSWRPDSDIAKLNGRAGIEPVPVSSDAFELLRLAKRLHGETHGAFDVTIGPLWDLWPFRDSTKAIPSRREIDATLPLVDASQIVLDPAHQTAFLPRRGMRVNLGAIGKGYAARLATDVLKQRGIRRAAISAGGDLFLLGRKTTGPWIVEIEHPRGSGQPIERFAAADTAVATSGNAKRFLVRDGRRYGHILDPKTGLPAADCQSVTIVTPDPAVADAYATAVFVMGPQAGLAWVESRPDVETLIVDRGGNVHHSSGWSDTTGRPPAPPLLGRSPSRAATPQVTDPSSTRGHRTTPPLPSGHGPQPSAGHESGEMATISAGSFLAGENRESRHLPAFRIDRTEVTNAQYRRFLQANQKDPHRYCHPQEPANKDHTPRYWREFRPPLFRNSVASELAPFNKSTFRQDDHPVVGVDWWDAFAYARWAGKRLPTRDEWERAARGTDGRLWPWGDDWNRKRANGGGEKWGERDGVIYLAPADSFSEGASPDGCLHMAGNVAEWTEEGFVMGGSFRSNPSQMTCFAAELRRPGYRAFCIGFRCAADPPVAKEPSQAPNKKQDSADGADTPKAPKKSATSKKTATPKKSGGES